MGNESILNALKSLHGAVDKTDLTEKDKIVMKGMIDKLTMYYTNKYNYIVAHSGGRDVYSLTLNLSSKMVDLIVMINDVLRSRADVYGVVNAIYKEINYDASKGQFKRIRLI